MITNLLWITGTVGCMLTVLGISMLIRAYLIHDILIGMSGYIALLIIILIVSLLLLVISGKMILAKSVKENSKLERTL